MMRFLFRTAFTNIRLFIDDAKTSTPPQLKPQLFALERAVVFLRAERAQAALSRLESKDSLLIQRLFSLRSIGKPQSSQSAIKRSSRLKIEVSSGR